MIHEPTNMFKTVWDFAKTATHSPNGITHIQKKRSAEYSKEERQYLAKSIEAFLKYHEGNPDLISVWISAFESGIAYAAVYLDKN